MGQSLAAIDEPFHCSLAASQLQVLAQEAVMQPNDSHLMHTLSIKLMLGEVSAANRQLPAAVLTD